MKLPFTVFYSWQSDLVGKYNRNYILDALKKAATAIGRDDTVTLEPVVDRDTMGLPGSPSIVESITAKIARSDLFIADISIVSPMKNRRPTPNPNVLFELGYASAVLGWDRIILIQNTHYGGPEKLPFDLRGRRILKYEASEALKTTQKQQLKDNLLHTLKEALSYTHSELPHKEHPVWWGSWEQRTATNASGGHLHITRVSSDAFFFHILIFDGARSGVMQGRATILTPHSAFGRIETSDNEFCEISFQRHQEHGQWQIVLVQGERCRYFHGVGIAFSGTYMQAAESSIGRGFLDELDMNELLRMCGSHLRLVLEKFSIVTKATWEDSRERYTRYTSFARGSYGNTRTLIVLTDLGKVWCVAIDNEQSVVRYFHNTPETERPFFIKEWLEGFGGSTIVVNEPGDL